MIWRVIDLEGCDIYSLHAAEEYLLHQVNEGKAKPTILFSRPGKPAISIGKLQNLEKDVDLTEVRQGNIDLTRRKTGGRTVYVDQHYYIISVIGRKVGNKTNTTKIYEETCGTLMHILHDITGVKLELRNVNEITTTGERIVGGAAQRDMLNAYLVHCYVRHRIDLDMMLRFIKIDNVKLDQYRQEFSLFASSLELEMKQHDADLYRTLKRKFMKQMGEVIELPLTAEESTSIEEMIRQHYRNEEYIRGTGDEPSRGSCDLIAGSGDKARLRIPDLVGKVSFR